MKVIFMENVEGTAMVGEVKDVKSGFARNYLLPRGLAAPAVEPYLTRAGSRAKVEEKRQADLDKDATGIVAKLEGTRIRIEARAGEQGKLFGSVTSVHIAEEVSKLTGDEFDHRKVLLPESIKEVGVQPIRLRLTRNVEATIEVEVFAEGVEEEEAVVEGDAAEATAVAEAEALDDATEASDGEVETDESVDQE